MTNNKFIPTDTKILINEWQTLHDKIVENAQLVKIKKTEEASSSLLSEQQLNDALNGPLQYFFKQKLKAYATISKVRLLLTTTQDDIFKNNPHDKVSLKDLEKINTAELDKMQQTLNELTKAHYQQWQEKRKSWDQQLTLAMTANNISLSEIEIKELKDKEPLSELMDRFIDLNIKMPSIEKMDFEQYLRLKVYLTIRNSLSRQQEPHDDEAITKLVKKLNREFNQIHQEEKQLIKTQRAETEDIIKSLSHFAR